LYRRRPDVLFLVKSTVSIGTTRGEALLRP